MPGFFSNLLGLPSVDPAQIPKDQLPDLNDGSVFPDPAQEVADRKPQPDAADLARVLDLLERWLALQLPDHRPEGAQEFCALQPAAFTVTNTGLYTIPGNQRRLSLSLYNSGPNTVYVVPEAAFDTSQGMPIPVNAEREIKAAAPVRLLTASGTAAMMSLEESS